MRYGASRKTDISYFELLLNLIYYLLRTVMRIKIYITTNANATMSVMCSVWVGSFENTLSLLEDSKADDGEGALLLLLLLSGNEGGKTEGVLVRLLSLLDGEDVIWTSCSFLGLASLEECLMLVKR